MPKLAEFKVSFNLPAIEKQTDYLRQIVENAVISATQAGAQVLYDEVQRRAAGFADTGSLASAIYQWRNKDEQRPGHAQYKISWRKGTGKANIKTKNGSQEGYGLTNAAHGILVEYGYIQRYASYVGSDGQWYTAIRPEMRNKPRPKSRASQAIKDAYYVLRKDGPVQVLPRSFLRAGYAAAKGRALDAARIEMTKRINAGML
jgi:hypothetical protein